MKGIAIRMAKEYGSDGIAHVNVLPYGEIERVTAETLPVRIEGDILEAEDRSKTRLAGSQLETIRHLSLMGWRVCQPSLWGESK